MSSGQPIRHVVRPTGLLPLPPWALAGILVKIVAIGLIATSAHRALVNRGEAAQRTMATLAALNDLTQLQLTLLDAETGHRGFLLSRDDRFLQPFAAARQDLPGTLRALESAFAGSAEQRRRLDGVAALARSVLEQMEQGISARQEGAASGTPLAGLDRGRATMDRLRAVIEEMRAAEHRSLAERQAEWETSRVETMAVSWGGSGLLLAIVLATGYMTSRDHRTRETEAWVRGGLGRLREALQGDRSLPDTGQVVADVLSDFLQAQVATVYLSRPDGRFERVAAYALPPEADPNPLRPGDGLLGETVRARRVLRVSEVPEHYLSIASSVGRSAPRELLLAPAMVDRTVYAVIELGFFRRVDAADIEFLTRSADALGVAVRSARDRSRLEELLEETQRQAEELQTQQEELRVSNEELEEHARALRESQARLETQQAELEQTNTHLEAQTQLLEDQKALLAESQRTLAARAADLARSNQYKSEFLANMSHELRTPLNSTLILAKLLADNKGGNLTAEQVRFAETISSAGHDLLALINDILDLSKIEAGRVEIEIQPVDVPAFVADLVRPFQPAAAEKGLTLETSLDPEAPSRIDTDPQRLAQILKNLIANALKFTEHGGIELRVSPAGGGRQVAWAVRDTGIGIPADQQELIFEAFRQADGSTHRKFGGTGLGLSISRDLARLLGGRITVDSRSGAGSTFTLTLPVDRSAEAPSAPAVPPAAAPAPPRPAEPPAAVADDRDRLASDTRTILVIEDDERFAQILVDLAHQLGFQCVVAPTAREGLEAAVAYAPRAIVLDVNLPDQSGLGVLDQLKRDPRTRHLPVHVASVADYTQEALERGAVGYALKPVKREELVEAFRRLERKMDQRLRRVLVVDDDERQRESIRALLAASDVEITGVALAADALARLRETTFDCMVLDLTLPDLSGLELLERMAAQDDVAFPPVIVYTGRSLSPSEEQRLHRFSKSIIIKDARSPERLLDEVTLFLHQVESQLPPERQRMLLAARDRESAFDGRRILVVEDDARNIFALSSVLEPKGATIDIARNGREALAVLERRARETGGAPVDLVLMDIMMPEMDGIAAIREIRRRAEWQRLPIIALTAKAMRDDQERCLAAGASDYIAKPLDVDRLLSLIRVWMPR